MLTRGTDTACAHCDLLDRLLRGDVEGRLAGAPSDGVGDSEKQRALARARLACEQEYLPAHQAATDHAIEFGDTGLHTRGRGTRCDLGDLARTLARCATGGR